MLRLLTIYYYHFQADLIALLATAGISLLTWLLICGIAQLRVWWLAQLLFLSGFKEFRDTSRNIKYVIS